ncbi:PepSY-associated TM helix domain-containing protein [Altererythrobacter sp. BO-6]|uniref:PepSY-associated TM helix domain-containing protein n=1 Tax=Altererythrobacter sp. BO-6 TaxID=2604537 RepID=UPI0019D17CB1|nr:PepSY-associated TM helix domain-containing protein [Altererythrobacter sp. BO-6]
MAFWLHNIFGLKLSLFLGFVCLTGTIATVAHEIEWLYKPEVRATAHEVGTEDWGAMWEAAQRAYPDATLSSIGTFDRSDSSYFAKSVSAQDAAGEGFTIYVDPGTNTVTGHEYGRSLQDFMRAIHYYLFIPRDVGFYLVSSLAFVLLGSLVTGLIIYKKFWRGFFKMPRVDRNLRTLLGDLHRLFGLWSAWFAAVIALTSIYYFFEWSGLDWNSPTPQVEVSHSITTASAAQVDRWSAIAREAKPGIAITAIYLPYTETDPVIVQGHWQAALVRERADAVFIDPATSAIVGQRTAHEMGIGERIVHTVDPLHFGTFGGLVTKIIWAVFGLLLTILAVTGACIYAKRTRLAIREGVNLSFLDYLGAWKWPSVALVTVVPAIAFLFW